MKINLLNFCEFDKYAVTSYCAIHDESKTKNLGDITKVDIQSLPLCDFLSHGSPCQDFSNAGLGKGANVGTDTRSSLMWNSVEIIEQTKPKFVIWENVKNVLSKKHKHNFDKYVDKLNDLGYNTYYQVLNARDYGVPHHRQRIFAISIRKDIDCGFAFPSKQELIKGLDDLLDCNVDEKYFISNAQIDSFQQSTYMQSKRRLQEKDWCDTLCARDYKDPKLVSIRNPDNNLTLKRQNIRMKNIIDKYDLKKYNTVGIDLYNNSIQDNYYKTLMLPNHNDNYLYTDDRIRKLTQREYYKLMDFTDDDFQKAQNALNDTFYKGKNRSGSQLYKQAGNSIVVNVIAEIYKELKKQYPNDFIEDLSMISLFSGIGAFEKAFKKI